LPKPAHNWTDLVAGQSAIGEAFDDALGAGEGVVHAA
jgi:hypothetical protein